MASHGLAPASCGSTRPGGATTRAPMTRDSEWQSTATTAAAACAASIALFWRLRGMPSEEMAITWFLRYSTALSVVGVLAVPVGQGYDHTYM